MFKSDDTMLMIASSGQNSPFPSINPNTNIVQPGEEQKGDPLKGVKYDMMMFRKKFKEENFYCIQTSQHCGILLGRDYVKGWLAHKFKNSLYNTYLFYSGHGHTNGDWAIQTSQHPEGDRLSFQELRDLNISVFAACGMDCKSSSLSQGGGFFNRCILNSSQQLNQQQIDLLFSRQTPYYINSSNKAQRLQPHHIKQLHCQIKNAIKISTEPQPPPANTTTTNTKNLQQQEQEELKQAIINKMKVKNWGSLSAYTTLELQNSGISRLPEQIGNLTQLTSLKLWSNKMTELPSTLPLLRNLQLLGLSRNHLTQLPHNLGKLVNLKVLYINDNLLTVFPGWIGKLGKLERLEINGNKIEVEEMERRVMLGLQHLSTLYMSKYQIPTKQQMQQFQHNCQHRGIDLYWTLW